MGLSTGNRRDKHTPPPLLLHLPAFPPRSLKGKKSFPVLIYFYSLVHWYFWITSTGILYRGITTTRQISGLSPRVLTGCFPAHLLTACSRRTSPTGSARTPPRPLPDSPLPGAARGRARCHPHPPRRGVYLSPCLLLEGGGCSTVWLPSISTTHLVFSSSSARRGGTGLQPRGGRAPFSPHPLAFPLTSPVHGSDPDGHLHLGVRHLSPPLRRAAPLSGTVQRQRPCRAGARQGPGGEGGGGEEGEKEEEEREAEGGRRRSPSRLPAQPALALPADGVVCITAAAAPPIPAAIFRRKRGGEAPSSIGKTRAPSCTGSEATTPLFRLPPRKGAQTENRQSSAPRRQKKGRSGACAGRDGEAGRCALPSRCPPGT